MMDFAEHLILTKEASVLQGVPAEGWKHSGHTGFSPVVMKDKSGSLTLNALKLVNIFLYVRTPCTRGILQLRSNKLLGTHVDVKQDTIMVTNSWLILNVASHLWYGCEDQIQDISRGWCRGFPTKLQPFTQLRKCEWSACFLGFEVMTFSQSMSGRLKSPARSRAGIFLCLRRMLMLTCNSSITSPLAPGL